MMTSIMAALWSIGLRTALIWGGLSLATWLLIAVVIYLIVT